MKREFKDGKIIAKGLAFEKALYDASNNKISVRFDGNGVIDRYSIIGDKVYYNDDNGSLKFIINGKELSFNASKKVEMIGRIQKITYCGDWADIAVKMFLDKYEECVFQRIDIRLKNPGRAEIGLFMGAAINADEFNKSNIVKYDNGFCIASNQKFVSVEEEYAIFFDIESDDSISVDLVYAFNNSDLTELCNKAEYYEQRALKEIEAVKLPDSVLSETDKAIYYSTYFCSLENYKEIGEFKGFMAGCNYVSPARTYYRDSYFTVLAMYNGNTEMVRNEIVTLTKGIPCDGSCPSAVISDFSSFWGQHYDSPSMLCIMTYDYVNNTGDFSVLDESISAGTVSDSLERVIKKLSLECDESGLIVKKGKYNLRDWADCVHRVGYVSYVNILFARALYCMSRLTKDNPEKSKAYEERYYQVKAAINNILWDESLGYYINFKNDEKQENNLSIDTVLAVIYGISDSERSKRILDNCEKMLESRNHKDIDDFGVMCVYPLYSCIDTARAKSARPFDYHNGADWPYWSAMYAYALKLYGREYSYPLTRWFEYNIENGNYTPVEFYSPYCKTGSSLQGWSSAPAFVYWDNDCSFFKNKI